MGEIRALSMVTDLDRSKLCSGNTDNVTIGPKLETGSGDKWVGSDGKTLVSSSRPRNVTDDHRQDSKTPILPNVCGSLW